MTPGITGHPPSLMLIMAEHLADQILFVNNVCTFSHMVVVPINIWASGGAAIYLGWELKTS